VPNLKDVDGNQMTKLAFSETLQKLEIEFTESLREFEAYEPLLSGLKLTEMFAVWMTVTMIYRRIIMVFVAMFLANYAWIQVISFVLCSLFIACIVCYVKPYINPTDTRLEIFNEFMVLSEGYFSMVYVGLVRNISDGELCGLFLLWIIRIHIAVNLIVIVKIQLNSLKLYQKKTSNRAKVLLAKRADSLRKKALRATKLGAGKNSRKMDKFGRPLLSDETDIAGSNWFVLKALAMLPGYVKSPEF